MTNCYDIAKTLGNLRYDGVQSGLWHQFTELDETIASYGASFYVRVNDQNLNSVAARREEVRIKFQS